MAVYQLLLLLNDMNTCLLRTLYSDIRDKTK